MRAARFHNYGDPDVLVVEETAEPHAVAGSVRVKVQAVSVNPVDYLLRSGAVRDVLPLSLPAIPGRDAVGIIDEVGEGVSEASIGELVFGLGGVSDTTAEFAVLTAWSPVPSNWSIEQAAAAGLAGATAANVIAALGDLEDKTLLIEGASGAVGTAVASLARAAGARVIGTGRQESHDYLSNLGVVPTTYGAGLAERVAAIAPEGIYAAVHSAPSASLPDLVTIVGEPSRVVTVIDAEGAARLRARKVDAANDSALLHRAADAGRRGLYTPRVDHVLPLSSIQRAHELAKSGAGKIVVTLTTHPVDVTAAFVPLEGEFSNVSRALKDSIDQVREEPGCIRYEITDESEGRIVLTERWESAELLELHGHGTAVQQLGESLSGRLAGPPQIVRSDRAS